MPILQRSQGSSHHANIALEDLPLLRFPEGVFPRVSSWVLGRKRKEQKYAKEEQKKTEKNGSRWRCPHSGDLLLQNPDCGDQVTVGWGHITRCYLILPMSKARSTTTTRFYVIFSSFGINNCTTSQDANRNRRLDRHNHVSRNSKAESELSQPVFRKPRPKLELCLSRRKPCRRTTTRTESRNRSNNSTQEPQ